MAECLVGAEPPFDFFLNEFPAERMFSTPRKDRAPFMKVIYAPYIQWDQFTSVQYHLDASVKERWGWWS